MQGTLKKSLTVVLAAVLFFAACFPVPSGAFRMDRARFGQANANPAVLAVPVVLATAVAAYGVYITGTSVAEYEANVQAFYDGYSNASSYWSQSWAQYCQDKGSFDNALQSCVTSEGNINLQTLTDNGFWDGVRSYSAYCVSNDDFGVGVDSYPTVSNLAFGNFTVETVPNDVTALPGYSLYSEKIDQYAANYKFDGYGVSHWSNAYGNWITYTFYFARDVDNPIYFAYGTFHGGVTAWTHTNSTGSFKINEDNVYIQVYEGNPTQVKSKGTTNNTPLMLTGAKLVDGVQYYVIDGGVSDNEFTVSSGVVANVISSVLDNTAAMPTTTVEPFAPTAEQLSTGYTMADVLEATQAIGGDVAAIAAQISGLTTLLSPLAGIAQNVQNIRDWWSSVVTSQSTPFPWLQALWNSLFGILGATPLPQLLAPIGTALQSLVSWVGNTPFGTVIGSLLDAVLGIPAYITGGVQSLSALLQGILDASLGLAGDIADALGLSTFIDALLGPLNGILGYVSGQDRAQTYSGGFTAPQTFAADMEALLRDKVPFCYIIRSRDAIAAIGGNMGAVQTRSLSEQSVSRSGRTFYFDLELPYAGEIRFDGEQVLSQPLGYYDIGTTIRLLATALLCFGLLLRAWKTAERTIGGL